MQTYFLCFAGFLTFSFGSIYNLLFLSIFLKFWEKLFCHHSQNLLKSGVSKL